MVNSINGYTGANTYKGISGLASGMDTESMIDTMLKASNSRLSKLYQRQQSITWKTQGYRDVTSSLVDFSKKFLNPTSPTSLRNPAFFDNCTITAKGSNAGSVTASGSVNALKNFQIYGISNLAETGAFTTSHGATQQSGGSQAIFSDAFSGTDFTDGKGYSKLEGETIKLKMNGKQYTVTLENVKVGATDGENAANIADALNAGLKKAGLEGKIKAGVDGGKIKLNVFEAEGTGSTELYAGSETITEVLGLKLGDTAEPGGAIKGSEAVTTADSTGKILAKDMVGKSFTLDLDGLKRTITFDAGDKLDEVKNADDFMKIVQKKVGAAFGGTAPDYVDSKVQVGLDNGSLVFMAKDKSSILSVASGDKEVLGGKGFMGVDIGDANRLLMYDPLVNSNLNGGAGIAANLKGGGSESITVNGTEFKVFQDRIEVGAGDSKKTLKFDKGVSVNDIVNTINNSDAGVTVKYNSTSDGFSVIAKESGALGKTDVSGGELSKALFGDGAAQRNVTLGEDAKVTVSMDGGRTSSEITRNSNNFVLDGISVTLNSEFTSSALGGTGDKITFEGKTNVDEVVKGIKDMVEQYNELIKSVNAAFTSKPDKDYQPLTQEQRSSMSESEIKAWEEKAQTGILFGDPIVRELATDIRFALSLPSNGDSLSRIGIVSSTDWTQNGSLEVKEDVLRQALEGNPEQVRELFTGGSSDDVTGTSPEAGVMVRLEAVMNKYTKTTGERGLLINKAGHSSSPLSLMDNAMYKEASAMDAQIAKMKESIANEQDKYHRQFTRLEMYINQMNSQSSWLTQQTTG